jgi:hypothetical protein
MADRLAISALKDRLKLCGLGVLALLHAKSSFAQRRQDAKAANPRTPRPLSFFRPTGPAPPPPTSQDRQTAALTFLDRSFQATGNRGSSHSYSPLFGWARAYPETTGYLIDTLFDYAARHHESALAGRAFQAADWLCTLQLPGGAFPGLLAGSRRPSVFNTAQILFGLARAVRENPAGPQAGTWRRALKNALDWLLEVQEADGSWRRAAYVKGFTPSYYTRAVWGVLEAARVAPHPAAEAAMARALRFYGQRFLPGGAVADWGFHPGGPAFTHTVAYTLEGFWESATLLEEESLLEKTLGTAGRLLEVRRAAGRTAGRYDRDWRGDYSFLCLPGNAQLSVFFRRVGTATGRTEFVRASELFLQEALPFQNMMAGRAAYGGLPGSAPFWGPYLRGRYPNWGVKFLLDAL